MIAIIDYRMGNIRSVINKLKRTGCDPVVTSDPKIIQSADKLVLPGVGHFKTAMENLEMLYLTESLNEMVIIKKTPILGICLGMQIMARHSEEGDALGLGWIDADVVRFKIEDSGLQFGDSRLQIGDSRLKIADSRLKIADGRLKIPHVGWNTLEDVKDSPLFRNVDIRSEFYFVHSYHINCNDPEDVLALTVYGYPFVSVIHKENIFGVQFHPEKSHDAGEILLKNFVDL